MSNESWNPNWGESGANGQEQDLQMRIDNLAKELHQLAADPNIDMAGEIRVHALTELFNELQLQNYEGSEYAPQLQVVYDHGLISLVDPKDQRD